MYIVNSVSTTSHIEALCKISEQEALFVVIEANEKDSTQYPKGFLSQLLLTAVSKASKKLNSNNLPLDIANLLRDEFTKMTDSEHIYNGVLYAGVMLTPKEIQVCTAGDIRIHLIEKQKLMAVTKDHNLIDDVPDEIPDQVKLMPPEVLRGAVTRIIGPEIDTVPETRTWNVTGDYSILICTSQFHLYKSPQEYFAIDIDSIPRSRTGVNTWGTSWLVSRIDQVANP
jgi:serine/threonine protein phosphatase PrpC